MRQFKTDGVLFDLDGTLWDSGDGVVEGYNLTAERMGLGRTFTPDQMHSVMGLQSQAILDRLVPDLSPERQIAFRNEVSRCECEILRTGRGSRLLPGVRELLETLRPLCPLFIVSNCMNGYIEAFLEAYGLASYFADYEHPGRTGLSKGENIRLVACVMVCTSVTRRWISKARVLPVSPSSGPAMALAPSPATTQLSTIRASFPLCSISCIEGRSWQRRPFP